MATVYVDSNWTGSTTGSQSTPFNTLAQATTGTINDGDTLALKCGSVFRESMGSYVLQRNFLRIVAYGEGARPRIVGSDIITSWSYNATYGLFSTNLGSNVGGNVTENGVPLRFTAWNTDIATTAPNIPQGGFTFDSVNFILYVRPGGGNMSGVFEVSSRLYGIYALDTRTGHYIEGVEISGFSRHGMIYQNKTNLEINDVYVRQCGGVYSGGFYIGNGIEISKGCDYAVCRDSRIEDIFDSAISPQLFEASAATLTGVRVIRNTLRRCGMGGVEISSQTASNSIYGTEVGYNDIADIGQNNWSGDRGGSAFYIAVNGGNTVEVTGNLFHHNKARRCQRGYLTANAFGSNVVTANDISDCYRGFYLSRAVSGGLASRDVLSGNVVSNCTDGLYQWGNQVQNTDIRNGTFINCTTGINMPGNASAVVDVKNSIFKGTGTAFSVVVGTLTESYNAVDTTVTPGRTLSGTDIVTDLDAYCYLDGMLKTYGEVDGQLVYNELARAGTYVQGVTLKNGRLRPGWCSIGAYQWVLPR